MTNTLIIISVWLHALGTVILIGHYCLLALIYIPALKSSAGNTGGAILSEISRRSRGWLYAALLIFLITGTHLLLIDDFYLGIGNFGNPWSILMLVKHALILGMLGVGFWFNAILRVGPMLSSKTGSEQALERFQLYVIVMAIIGLLVLLMTAVSQVLS